MRLPTALTAAGSARSTTAVSAATTSVSDSGARPHGDDVRARGEVRAAHTARAAHPSRTGHHDGAVSQVSQVSQASQITHAVRPVIPAVDSMTRAIFLVRAS